jgi:hypothetical protein
MPPEAQGVLLPGLFLGGFFLFWFLLARSRRLFKIAIESGKQTVVLGYAPVGLLNDFGSAVRGVKRGSITATKTAGGARLSFAGDIDAGVAQRLRNIFGLYPVARLRAPELNKRQAVSDAFTLAWVVSLVRSIFR